MYILRFLVFDLRDASLKTLYFVSFNMFQIGNDYGVATLS